MPKTQVERFQEALQAAGENGLTTDELKSKLNTKDQAIHSCAYALKKKKLPGFRSDGKGRYFLSHDSSVEQSTPAIHYKRTMPSIPSDMMNKLMSIDNDEDREDILHMIKKSLYYQGSAQAMVNASTTVANLRRKLS